MLQVDPGGYPVCNQGYLVAEPQVGRVRLAQAYLASSFVDQGDYVACYPGYCRAGQA